MRNYNVTFIDVATTFLKSIHKKTYTPAISAILFKTIISPNRFLKIQSIVCNIALAFEAIIR